MPRSATLFRVPAPVLMGCSILWSCRCGAPEPETTSQRAEQPSAGPANSAKGAEKKASAGTNQSPAAATRRGPPLLPRLEATREKLAQRFGEIPVERKKLLEGLGLFVRSRLSTGERTQVLFHCATDPMPSQLAQAWLTAASTYHGLRGVRVRSVGTPASLLPEVLATLERNGFQVAASQVPEPRIVVSPQFPAVRVNTQGLDDPELPRAGFAAVTTCTEPSSFASPTSGAALRVALPYDFPQQEREDEPSNETRIAARDEASARVGIEMFYLASLVARTR